MKHTPTRSIVQNPVNGNFLFDFQRFHAIIGPNGSGKSNVIDSMLFVFGYRANKIRCKKLSVLIHNSKAHGNVQSCSVAVHFAEITDKDDGSYEIVPGSQFIIAREAYRNNSSFYTIDNRRVHFKEVAKLLKKHNVDLDHNRFLILQVCILTPFPISQLNGHRFNPFTDMSEFNFDLRVRTG